MLGITTQSRPAKSIEESNEYFSEMVLSGREEEAIGYLSHEYLSGNSFASLCDGPVRHCLEQVGHAWAQTSDGQEKNLRIAEEHRSVDIILQALQQLRRMVQSPETAPVAIGGAPPGDPYLVPSLCAALSLLGDGWRTANLGPSSPSRSCEPPQCEPKPNWFGSVSSNLPKRIYVRAWRCSPRRCWA